jgi:hypothetical protein
MESYTPRNNTLFDLDEEEKGSAWGKALAGYRAKKLPTAEIDKYRQAYQKKFGMGMVKTLASGSKKK